MCQCLESVSCVSINFFRLWHHVTTFGQKMSQLRVTVDQFADGGVPSSLEQWSKLFEYRACTVAVDDGMVERQLCDDCSAFFEFSDRLSKFSWNQKMFQIRDFVSLFC